MKVLVAIVSLGLAACGSSGSGAETTIGPGGGTVTLDGVAEVEFPAGAFASETEVRIELGTDPVTAAIYDETSTIFEPGPRAPYFIHIVTGDVAPVGAVRVKVFVPKELGIGLLANVYADVLAASDLDTFEQFELIDTDERDATSLAIALDGARFAELRRGTHEAVLAVAGSNIQLPPPLPRIAGAASACGPMPLSSPLDHLAVRSPFSLTREVVVNGRTYVGHYGTDFIAADGDALYAVGAGKVLESYVSDSFGETVVLSIPGAGAVRYAHMQTGSRLVQKGDTVCEGQKIGKSDNTGLSTGAHLHFELAPNGAYGSNAAKIDPTQCIDAARKPLALGGTWLGTGKLEMIIPTSANTHIEQTVTATNVSLVPFEFMGVKSCDRLVPRSGFVQLDRTETYIKATGELCTVTTTGMKQLTHKPQGPDGLGTLIANDLPTYVGSMAEDLTVTLTDGCTGESANTTASGWWLEIGLDENGFGPTITDRNRLNGMFHPIAPSGGSMTSTWDFGRQ